MWAKKFAKMVYHGNRAENYRLQTTTTMREKIAGSLAKEDLGIGETMRQSTRNDSIQEKREPDTQAKKISVND